VASSTASAFIVGLRTALQARGGLTGIPIDLVAPADLTLADRVVLVRAKIEGTQEYAALGRLRRHDAYLIPGLIRAIKQTGAAGAQDSDSVFQAAMDRAAQLLDEVILQLRDAPPAVGNQTTFARVSAVAYLPFPADAGGWGVDCEYEIDYTARVS
jgi:hypothetical protein